MNYLFHEGGKTKKTTNSKLGSKTKKGGNFLGSIGELVAPTGWESFVTTAGLFAIDRADAALRRVKKEKKNTMTGGKHGSKQKRDKREKFRKIMGWTENHGQTRNKKGNLIGTYPHESIMDYIILDVEFEKNSIPINDELYEELYEKAIIADEFRNIVGWKVDDGIPYNMKRNWENRYVEYPDEFIMHYIIKKVREHLYEIPLTKELYEKFSNEAQRILNERNRAAEVSISQVNNIMRTALQQRNSRKVNSSNSSFSNLGSIKNSAN